MIAAVVESGMLSRSHIGGGTTVPVSDDKAPIWVFSGTVQTRPAPTASVPSTP